MKNGPEGLQTKQLAHILNGEFKNGTPAYEILPHLRALPRPICVDFNETLVNFKAPYTVNPQAREFLNSLRTIGNVSIVTQHPSWSEAKDSLKEFRLWHDDIVLMTRPTWQCMHDEENPQRTILIDEFIQTVGKNFSMVDFRIPLDFKRVAPLFMKPFAVPIIDDLYYATNNNPGMFGILIKSFEPNDSLTDFVNKNHTRPSLLEAAEIVRNFYKNAA